MTQTVNQTSPPGTRRAALLPLVLGGLLFLLPACKTETSTRPVDRNGQVLNADRIATGAPQDLHDISGFLLKYQAKNRKLPATLQVLRTEKIMPATGYPYIDKYAYRPTGLGTLPDGHEVILVDTAFRLEGHVWCILREPDLNPRANALNVMLVSLDDLRSAAQQNR